MNKPESMPVMETARLITNCTCHSCGKKYFQYILSCTKPGLTCDECDKYLALKEEYEKRKERQWMKERSK